jgi:superfamily I DNA/RNA helicase
LALDVLLGTIADPMFDVVVVDEGQDLLRDAFLDVIEALAGGNLSAGRWRIFLDPNQNIFGGVSPSAMERIRDTRAVEWPLTVNCRNTAPIATQVSLLSGTPLSAVLASAGPDVELHWYDSEDDERTAASDTLRRLRSEGFRSEQTVVLSRHRLESSVMHGMSRAIVDVSRGQDVGVARTIRFSTVASFKGLEADVVLLVDVDDLASNEGLASVYVGASRAKVALFVFIAAAEKARFQELAKEFGRAVMDRDF